MRPRDPVLNRRPRSMGVHTDLEAEFDRPPLDTPFCSRCFAKPAVLDGICGRCRGKAIAAESGGDRNAGPARLADRPRLTLIRTEL